MPLPPLVEGFTDVHQIIRFFQEIIQGMASYAVRAGADAGVKFILFLRYFIVCLYALLNAMNDLLGALPDIPARQSNQELVSADPGRHLLLDSLEDRKSVV